MIHLEHLTPAFFILAMDDVFEMSAVTGEDAIITKKKGIYVDFYI